VGEQIIDAITNTILSRHPGFGRAAVRAEVTASYNRLEAGSRIPDHLALLVQHQVTDQLRRAEAKVESSRPNRPQAASQPDPGGPDTAINQRPAQPRLRP
jgi:hypothetical protein